MSNHHISLEVATTLVGPGWTPLLEQLYANCPDNVHIVTIKEKFGGLRVHWDLIPDARNPERNEQTASTFRYLVDRVEEDSFRVCERCGAAGEPRTERRWIRTLCDTCHEKTS